MSLKRINEKEFKLDVGWCWIFRDYEENLYIHTQGGHIDRIPKEQSKALKKYFKKED